MSGRLRTEPFDFTGSTGQRLSGRLERPDGEARAWALFAHCFTCSKTSLAATRIARALAGLGVGVLRFDFTGLGQSDGDFADASFSGEVRDLCAAAEAMGAAGVAPSLLVGHSLGGAAALAAAGELPEIRAVATLAAPFDPSQVERLMGASLAKVLEDGEAEVDLGGRPFRIRRRFIEDLRAQEPGERIAHLRRALLILHAPTDATVSVDNAAEIFLAARDPKSFVSLDDADHLLTRAADADYAAQVICAWSSRYLPTAAPTGYAPLDPGTVSAETIGGGKFRVRVQAGPVGLVADEPVDVGGLSSGPTPYELVSAGLAACSAMTVRMYAEQKGWPLDQARVTVSHAKDPAQTPPDAFTRQIALTGALDAEQRARLMEIAERCPVHKTLAQGARVGTTEAVGAPPASPPDDPAAHLDAMTRAAHAVDRDAG